MAQRDGIERILSRIVDWGRDRDDLRAIAVVGSHARADHPADEWSDLDLIFLARRPKRYLAGPEWIDEIEPPWLAVLEPTVVGGQQIYHITFAGGTKVDLVVVSNLAFALGARSVAALRRHPSLGALLPSLARDRLATLADLLGRGARLALDKDGLAGLVESDGVALPPPTPPTREEFLHLVGCFLNEQVSFALKLGRGELFMAKTVGESRLMAFLLEMIEWHTQVTTDRWSPVFEHGRLLEEWAPPGVVARLRDAFPGYDLDQVWQARLETADLFRSLAKETAARLGYAYPTQLEETVMAWVRSQAPDGDPRAPERSG